MTIDPDNSAVYFSGGWVSNGSTYVMTVSRSTNSGSTWERDTLATVYSCCYAIAVDPSSKSNIVYAGGTPGVYKSIDAGQTWTLSSTGLSGTVYDIAVNPLNASVLYAGTSSGVYKSTNASVNWSLTGLTGAVNDILLVPGGLDTLYAATTTGVYQSVNGGASWTAMNAGLEDTYVNALGINPSQRYLFAGTRSRGMYYWSLAVGAEEMSSPDRSRTRFAVCPNPAVNAVEISYQLETSGAVDLAVYDAQGRFVTRLVDHERLIAGDHRVAWNCADRQGNRVPAGVYFLKLDVAGTEYIKKLLVVR